MNINPLSILGAYLRGVRGVRKGEKAAAYSPLAPADPVEISGAAQEVERLSGTVSTQPDVRMERVSEVETKIASGKHNPTEKEMAESLTKAAVMDKML